MTILSLEQVDYYLLDVSKLSTSDLRLINQSCKNNSIEDFFISCCGILFLFSVERGKEMFLLFSPMQMSYNDAFNFNDIKQEIDILHTINERYHLMEKLTQSNFYVTENKLYLFCGDKFLPKFADLTVDFTTLSEEQQEVITYFTDLVQDDITLQATVNLFSRCKNRGNLARKISVCYLLMNSLLHGKELTNYFDEAKQIIKEVEGQLLKF